MPRALAELGPAGFAQLADELETLGYLVTCAIGLAAIEDYSHQDLIAACRAHPGLIPVAGFDPARDASPEALRALRAVGYLGIKINPHFSGLTRLQETLSPAPRAVGEGGLVVFFCTYLHCGIDDYPDADPLASLVALLREAPTTRVVLVHGGDVEQLRYAQLVRHNPQLLLDLSLTLMKLPGTSVVADLSFLFKHFDRLICIGSDWPEYSLAEVRARFEHFAACPAPDKRRHIAQANLLGFLGLRREGLGPPAPHP